MMHFSLTRAVVCGITLLVSEFTYADFSISGKIAGLRSGSQLTLLRQDLDARTESAEAVLEVGPDSSFAAQIEGEPGYFLLDVPGWGKVPLAVADGQSPGIQVDSTNSAGFSVSGSADTDILLDYEAFRKESLARLVYPPRASLNQATAAGVSAEKMAPLAQAEVDGYNAHKRELNDWTIENAGTSMALYATSLRWDEDHRIDEIQQLVDAFAARHPDLAITRSMLERLRLFRLTALGARASPLSGKDLEGKSISLDDFKGRVVLVDFWASWCGPCRVENRHYPKLLEKYSKHGFTVFGINLDDTRAIWARASGQDGVTWPQISDFQALNSPMAKAYNVTALPMSFLLDREGRILAKNLRGEGLADTLSQLFDTSP